MSSDHDGQERQGQADAGRWGAEDPAAEGEEPIWNSAVDNATGVAAILEMARALTASGHRPERSIVFVTFSAEEFALNGAVHYVSHLPVDGSRRVAMRREREVIEPFGSRSSAEISPSASSSADVAPLRLRCAYGPPWRSGYGCHTPIPS